MGLPTFSAYAPSHLVARRPVATDQVESEIGAPDGALVRFERPGQFCRIRVIDESGTAREGIFAMMSAPGEGALRFLVRTPNPEGGEAADALAAMMVGTP